MSDCILWYGARHQSGYGKVSIGGKKLMAHRVAWERKNGPIPLGMCVCHKCDNPPCINPDHLFLGTYGDNIKDCYKKKRRSAPSKPALTEQTAIRLKILGTLIPHNRIAKWLNVSQSYVRNIAVGIRFKEVTAQTRYGI